MEGFFLIYFHCHLSNHQYNIYYLTFFRFLCSHHARGTSSTQQPAETFPAWEAKSSSSLRENFFNIGTKRMWKELTWFGRVILKPLAELSPTSSLLVWWKEAIQSRFHFRWFGWSQKHVGHRNNPMVLWPRGCGILFSCNGKSLLFAVFWALHKGLIDEIGSHIKARFSSGWSIHKKGQWIHTERLSYQGNGFTPRGSYPRNIGNIRGGDGEEF